MWLARLHAALGVSIAVFMVASAAACPAALGPAALRVAPSYDPVAVDSFIAQAMSRHRIPGLALAITHGDQVVHVRGYGEARGGERVTGQTQFRIASLSKSFTALAVLQRVEAGQIELDAPVAHYLPGFTLADPLAAARITVRQLLNHTSGLADRGFVNGLGGQQQTLADRVAGLEAARPVDPPGAAFHYFDPNYQVLARLVEVVSGQAFDAYLQQHVFAPLAMQGSVSALTSALPTQATQLLAQGHIMAYGVPLALPELSGFLGGSGGVVSTASDMAHYLIAQGNHGSYLGRSVLSASNISLMQTPPAGIETSYAMGWAVSNRNGTRTIEHNGVLSTFYADAVLLPESGYGVVLLYNTYALSVATLAFPDIKNGVVELLQGRAPRPSKFSTPGLGAGMAAISVLIIALMIWRLRRLTRDAHRVNSSHWQRAWSWFWPLAPALVLLALPRLLALQSGRYFELAMLARAMPELVILLAVCATLGLLAVLVRVLRLTGPYWQKVPNISLIP